MYHVIGIYNLFICIYNLFISIYNFVIIIINFNYIFKKLTSKIYNDNKNSIFCLFNT